MKRKIKKECIEYNPRFKAHGYDHVRWVEHAADGLRLVGFADKIVGLRHMGWYTDEDGYGDTYRGVVYQLPSGGDGERFAYGYADPCNDGAALLCFDLEGSKEDAARAADQFAEIFAEEAREYSTAWGAGRRYEDLGEEIKEARKEALAIGAEMRANKSVQAPASCNVLREKIISLYHQIKRARKEREDLIDSYGKHPGWEE